MSDLPGRLLAGVFGGVLLVSAACGSAPQPRAEASPAPSSRASRAQRPDPCLPRAGEPAPQPLAGKYEGLARKARCQPDVLALMEDVAADLGVGCEYCHERRDFRLDTRRKQIANWMSSELSPRLRAKGHEGPVECADCHASDGRPTAKLLGVPRSESHAIEWMTTELVEKFTQADGKPLRCKTCHRENLGDAGFQRQLLLSDALHALPRTPEQ